MRFKMAGLNSKGQSWPEGWAWSQATEYQLYHLISIPHLGGITGFVGWGIVPLVTVSFVLHNIHEVFQIHIDPEGNRHSSFPATAEAEKNR